MKKRMTEDLTLDELIETREALLDRLDNELLPSRIKAGESALSKITTEIIMRGDQHGEQEKR
jgi:hypothetical protein